MILNPVIHPSDLCDIQLLADTQAGVVKGGGKCQPGMTIVITAVPQNIYYFTHWSEDGEVVSEDDHYMFEVTSPRRLIANFREATAGYTDIARVGCALAG